MVTFRQTECREVVAGVRVVGGGESVFSRDRVSVLKMKHPVDSHSHKGSRTLRVLSIPPVTMQVEFRFRVFHPF